MSEIRATTISDAAGTGPITLTGQSAAKAFANFNGTGSLNIRSSLNGSSITDNGTGKHALNFTSSFSDTNYMPVGAVSSTGNSVEYNHRFEVSGLTMTNAGWKEIQTINDGASGYLDVTHLSILCHGDLA